jgi:tetraacyldisaccharide 4'-kinase
LIAARLQQAWLRRGPLAWLLWPVSLLMGALVGLRRLAFRRGWARSVRLPVPVIVVGNRIVGGAGKTPTTIALLQHLQAQGWRPGVLSRGYKAALATDGPALIDAQTAPSLTALQVGDEPLLIWRRCQVPLMIGRDRAASGQALLAAYPEINMLVCDDGLQHLRLRRDIEIVVFDERGAGNGWLLPAGPLREPIDAPPPPELRAKPIVIYNAPQASTGLPGHLSVRHTLPLCPLPDWWLGQAASQSLAPADTQAASTWALAGIAHPQRFFDALRAQGLAFKPLPLADHADFSLLPWPATARDVIVTEKDAVKLDPARVRAERPGCRVWVAALALHPAPSFWLALDQALAALPPPLKT